MLTTIYHILEELNENRFKIDAYHIRLLHDKHHGGNSVKPLNGAMILGHVLSAITSREMGFVCVH
jgi:hypothetical protein